MLDTKLVAVVSNQNITINNRLVKAGFILGYMKASTQAEATKILATTQKVILLKIIIKFGGYPKVVSEYSLQFLGEISTKNLAATRNYGVTKLGARMITLNAKLSVPNFSNKQPIFQQPTNAIVVGSISAMNLTASQRYFSTGYVFYDVHGGLWHHITNADESQSGWILMTKDFSYSSTWSNYTKDVTNIVVQRPLQTVRDTVETLQANSKTFLTVLAVIAAILILKK